MIAKHMDRVVRGLQWPVAYAMAAISPLILATLALWIGRSANFPVYAIMFWLGATATLALTRSGWGYSKILKTAIRSERWITQSLLSFLLLQPTSTILGWVRTRLGFQKKIVSDPSTPTSTWLADDNWLIRTSPYFLPTASIVLWLLSALFLPSFLRSFVLGVGVAYHLLSAYFQLRYPDTTKSAEVYSKRFVWMFLVPMNLLVFATGYAFALEGFSGLQQVPSDLAWPLTATWKALVGTSE
ncbi:MAG: hypothetical protein WCP62_00055 [Planctomycetota bacterium]